jgi:DNA polymerase III delta prime subunit
LKKLICCLRNLKKHSFFPGKTTTVQLVCKELEFDIVEFNASDTRSKKLLHEEVSEMLSTQSLSGMFSGKDRASKILVDSHFK